MSFHLGGMCCGAEARKFSLYNETAFLTSVAFDEKILIYTIANLKYYMQRLIFQSAFYH